MTLDYLVKMLNIHERRKCGVPVIINGETGVGKTFLLEMLSILWNHSLLSNLNKEKCSLKDILITKLQRIVDLQPTCPAVKRIGAKDIAEVNSVLAALRDSTSENNISFDSLLLVLNLSDPHDPLKSLYLLFCSRLLKNRYNPLFSLVVFSDNSNIKYLFKLADSHVRRNVSFAVYSAYRCTKLLILHRSILPQPSCYMGCFLDNLRKCFTNFVFMLVCCIIWQYFYHMPLY